MIYAQRNAVAVLQALGFVANVDFSASEQRDGTIEVTWFSHQAQPEAKDLEAISTEALAVAAKEAAAIDAKSRAQDPFQKAFIAAVAEVTGIDAAALEAKVATYIDAQVKA